MLRVLLIAALIMTAVPAPALEIELRVGPGQEQAARRIREIPAARVERMADVFGQTSDDRIIVVIADDESSLARDVPEWVAGYAQPSAGVVVILPSRAQSYPYSDIPETYLHELAHVFIGRAAGDGDVPRWFHESIALTLSTQWTLEDRGRTTLAMIRRWDATPDDMNRWFRGDPGDVRRAYAIAEAFGRDFIDRYGILGIRRILGRVDDGVPFERAFQEYTGRTPEGAWYVFWESQTFISRTVPLITSGTVVWLLISLLALLAFRRRRARDARIREMWALEEQLELLAANQDDETVN